ncbi:hypothetical protein [Parapedobacter koreensis]|uniref:Uncharacterized protein n=1 Tax=Parapedobacter koreensis TaxID=332977 RepID=A0A1H7IF46_9SPHI|nr:hypothetical protein [Parapedobacter koreensis]SEK60150.1 hypothetical protein SAMN05421740_102192 [Parapedobacter koreensis]
MKARLCPLIAIFQLALLLGMLTSNMLFMHSHVANGRIIIHVHPYPLDDDGRVKQHPHNGDELYRLDILFAATFLGGETLDGIDALLFGHAVCHVAFPLPQSIQSPVPEIFYLRGPPKGNA